MKISRALDWHVEGEIVDECPPDVEVDPAYVENMKKDIIEERERIKHRKDAKMLKIRQKLQAQREADETKERSQ
jgi:hypothetical protein